MEIYKVVSGLTEFLPVTHVDLADVLVTMIIGLDSVLRR